MTSRDGLHFNRWNRQFDSDHRSARSGWESKQLYAHGLLQLPGNNRELALYATEAYYAGPGSRVRRFRIRTDGFVSVHADQIASEFLTKAFTFDGSQLNMFLTGPNGSLRFEIQDESGKAIPGYRLEEGSPLSAIRN